VTDEIRDQRPRLGGRGRDRKVTDDQDRFYGYRLSLRNDIKLSFLYGHGIELFLLCVLGIALSVVFAPTTDSLLRFEPVR
jgi:hypothetical protein